MASVPAGPVAFTLTNPGQVEHELVILKTDLAPNALKMKASEDKVDEEASGQNLGEVGDVEAGKTKSETFNLPAGHYTLLCNVSGHYRQGMVAALEVK